MISTKAPPMGWNSWYCFSESVSDARIREAASGMVERGFSAHGWKYINIDDCWQGDRGGRFNAIQGNDKFPDMKALADYVHSLGLKFGLYSTPWISSFAGFTGGTGDGGKEFALRLPEEKRLQKYQYYGTYPGGRELGLYRIGDEWLFGSDVRQWDEWCVDYVKVDWFPNDVPAVRRGAEELGRAERNIHLSLSSSASLDDMPAIAEYAQSWRISGDIRDNWESIVRTGFENAPKWMRYTSPGHWNDLDMLQTGCIGTASSQNTNYRKSDLTFEEQKTQFVLWSMYSAPLLLSCDMADADDTTFGLLANDRVIAVDQAPLCAQPEISEAGDELLRYVKKRSDGTLTAAFFNMRDSAREIETRFDGEDLFTGETVCSAELAPHGCAVFSVRDGWVR